MADLTTELTELNSSARALLAKYDDAFARLTQLSDKKRQELSKFVEQKTKELRQLTVTANIDEDKLQKLIEQKFDEFDFSKITAGNALKFAGKTVEEIKKIIKEESISQSTDSKYTVKTYSYGLSLLRSPQNADNIDNLFAQFKTIRAVWIYSKYKNFTSPKVEFKDEDASKFRFTRTTSWCTTNKILYGVNDDSVTFGWSNQGSICYKGYFIYVTVNKKTTGLIHACDCGSCGHYENKIYVNNESKCLGNSSNSSEYDVTIYVEGVLNGK